MGIGFLFCCLGALLFTGCGKAEEETDAADRIYYHIQETAIPDPDEALSSILGQEYRIVELDLKLLDGILYRAVNCYQPDDLIVHNFIQVLKTPYREWITEEVSYTGSLEGILGGKEERLVVLMHAYPYEKDNRHMYYLAGWEPGKASLERVQDSGMEGGAQDFQGSVEFFATSDGGYCSYDLWNSSVVTLYDEKFQLKEKKELGKGIRICGLLQEPESGDLLWYGIKNQETGVWRLEDGASVLPGGQSLGTVSAADFQAAYGTDGALYLADTQGLWRVAEGNLEEVCHFFDRDYPLTALYGMEALEDGSLILQAECTGEELVLRIEENGEPLPEKQEITMASIHSSLNSLNIAIAKFNRTNERYHVTTLYPYDEYSSSLTGDHRAEYEEFVNQLQMEIAAGRGPDLYFNLGNPSTIDPQDMAKNGYLKSLEGVLEDGDAYWTAALESGRIDGVLYGIPYECRLTMATYSEDFAGDRRSWTLPELMEAVRESGAEKLQWGFDGIEIVLFYGLYDNDNKDFIDWEAGESHLDEEPFKELLKFAREYADDKVNIVPNFEDLAKDVAEGRILAVDNFFGTITNWGNIWGSHYGSLENIFQGELSCIGYPRSEGNGIYVTPSMFYMNANSDKEEGVTEFLRYILSDEIQQRINSPYTIGNIGTDPWLPVRLSALEKSIEMARERNEQGKTGNSSYPALTEEQAVWAHFLIENAQPGNWKVKKVEHIIREELEPYFQGQRSAEETVRILNNRVQLYLDEQ